MLKNLNELIVYPFVNDIISGKLTKSKVELFVDNLHEFLKDENFRKRFGFEKKEYSLKECMILIRYLIKEKMAIEDLVGANQRSNPFAFLIKRIAKPEARTQFSQILLYYFKAYFEEIFEQRKPPQIVKDLKDRKFITFPIGSVLRGTARVESSDFDALIYYAKNGLLVIDPPGSHIVEGVITNPDYHPQKISFSQFLAEKLKSNPEHSHFYWDRLNDIIKSRPLNDKELESLKSKRFIFCEAVPFNIDDLIYETLEIAKFSVQELQNPYLRLGKFPYSSILEHYLEDIGYVGLLLITTKDFTFESVPGALLTHQRSVVKSLAQLQSLNQPVFDKIYNDIADTFYRFVTYEGGNHGIGKAYYEYLLYEYAKKSGRFDEKNLERASKLLRVVKRQITFPSFESIKRYFL